METRLGPTYTLTHIHTNRLSSPKCGLIILLNVETLVSEWGNIEQSFSGEHIALWFQPFLSVEIALNHTLIVEHVAHRLGDYHINLLWNVHLCNQNNSSTIKTLLLFEYLQCESIVCGPMPSKLALI